LVLWDGPSLVTLPEQLMSEQWDGVISSCAAEQIQQVPRLAAHPV